MSSTFPRNRNRRGQHRGYIFIEIVAAVALFMAASLIIAAITVQGLRQRRELMQRSCARQVLQNVLAANRAWLKEAGVEPHEQPLDDIAPWASPFLPDGSLVIRTVPLTDVKGLNQSTIEMHWLGTGTTPQRLTLNYWWSEVESQDTSQETVDAQEKQPDD